MAMGQGTAGQAARVAALEAKRGGATTNSGSFGAPAGVTTKNATAQYRAGNISQSQYNSIMKGGTSVSKPKSVAPTIVQSQGYGKTNGFKSPKPGQNKTTDVFGDLYGTRNQYTGQGLKLSTGEEITKFGATQDVPKDINLYGNAAREAEQANPGTISNRNDYLAYNMKTQGIQDKQSIKDFLSQQPGFTEASLQDQQNTVESIAARMGITKDTLTKEDLIAQEQAKLFEKYKTEQDKLITEGNKQEFVKRMDNLLGNDIRDLTPEEIGQLAEQTGLTPEEAQATATERAAARNKVYQPFQYQEEDLTTQKNRNIQDAQTQLDRARQDVQNNIEDITTQMQRDVAGYEKVGALKGYIQSSGYQQGIANVKSDAMKLVDRLKTQLANATADTAQYISRQAEDYATNMNRVKTAFTDDLLNLRLAGSNEINGLLTKYAPSEELMTKELDRLTEEYGMKSMDLYNKFLENYKGITDAAMYESEKIQQYQTKQKELENMTLSYLYSNNGMALRNMSDADIENLYKQGYIQESTVATLKAAKKGAIQDYNIVEAYKQSQTAANMAKAGEQATNTGNVATSVLSVPDGIYGGECVRFVNDILEKNGFQAFSHDADQTLANKISKINSKTPSIGSVLVRTTNTPDGQKYGDVVIVTGINGDTISYKGSNNDGNGYTYSGTISAKDASIKGYYDPIKAQKEQTTFSDISSATGLSISAFSYLTQGTNALSRMDSATRMQVMNEAQKFLTSRGVDAASFKSQYTALNDVLERSIRIMGNVQRDEMEISGTIDNLSDIASESELGSIKRANLVKLALGKEVNSPYASKYGFTLSTLREEVAGYYAALRGDNQPNESDSVRAADVIANGIAKGGIQGLKDAFEMNVKKLGENLPKNIENTNKQIWELFGVLDKYKGSSTQTPSNTGGGISSQGTSRR